MCSETQKRGEEAAAAPVEAEAAPLETAAAEKEASPAEAVAMATPVAVAAAAATAQLATTPLDATDTSLTRRAWRRSRGALGLVGRGLARVLGTVAVAAICVALLEVTRVLVLETGGFLDNIGRLLPLSLVGTVVALSVPLLLVRSLTNRLSVAVLLLAPFAFGLLIAHVMKMDALGKPLVPADLGLLVELWGVLESVIAGKEAQFGAIALAAALLIVAILWCLLRQPRWSMRLGERAAVFCAAAALLASEISSPWFIRALERRGVENVVWRYDENLRQNGFILPFLMNARQVLPEPEGYDEARLRALVSGGEAPPRDSHANQGGEPEGYDEARLRALVSGGEAASLEARTEKPDVVVYMAEAFWDVTKIGVQFSRDPLPNFHALKSAGQCFTMTSPQRGGGTANVEFEALTGISHAVLPPASVPYQHYLHRPLRALPALFREHGYRTLALHNFRRAYYSRDSVYPLLGFERFIAIDEMEPLNLDGSRASGPYVNNRGVSFQDGREVLFDGPYPSDDALVRRILNELDAPGDEPRFLFAIGMIGHGPFLYERWPEPDVTVTAADGRPPLSETTEHDIENMANATFRADRGLGYLVEALQKRQRPTILVWFGDHQPSLRKETFAEAGFEAGPREHRRFETEVLFWSNRPLPRIDAMPAFSVFYLSPKILAAAGLPLPRHLSMLTRFERVLRSLNDEMLQTADAQWFSGPRDARTPENARRVALDLSMLAYDRLAGERLSEAP